MKKMFSFILLLTIFGVTSVNAQVTIGSNQKPHAGAILDLQSTTRGLRLPNVALSDIKVFQLSANGSDATGMMVYNTSSSTVEGQGAGVYVWNGCKWMPVALNGSTNSGGSGSITVGSNTYRTYCYPVSTGLGCWMIDNSKEGTPDKTQHSGASTAGELGYYYLYSHAAGACPSGWSLPNANQWIALASYINGNATQAEKADWIDPSKLAGYHNGSVWNYWNTHSGWWSSSAANQVFGTTTSVMGGPDFYSGYYFSVRCIKNN